MRTAIVVTTIPTHIIEKIFKGVIVTGAI